VLRGQIRDLAAMGREERLRRNDYSTAVAPHRGERPLDVMEVAHVDITQFQSIRGSSRVLRR
jgi:hypothetical protein